MFYLLDNTYQLKLLHPFTCIIAGPTGCGKTVFLTKFLRQMKEMITPVPDELIICYGKYQPMYEDTQVWHNFKKVQLHAGLLEKVPFADDKHKTLVIIDDLMLECQSNKFISDMFTKGSHHDNISIILFNQNLFPRGNESRTISLNTKYFFLFKSPRDSKQCRHFGQQVEGISAKEFEEAYIDATRQGYSYLFLDFMPNTPTCVRYLSKILPGEETVAYLGENLYRQLLTEKERQVD